MYFSIDTVQCEKSEAEFNSISNKIKGCADNAYNIGMDLQFKNIISEILSLKIRRHVINIRTLAGEVENYRISLSEIISAYKETDNNITEVMQESAKGVQRHENLTDSSGVFDGWGGYGGDQGDLNNQAKVSILFWTFGGNQALYDIVRTYPQYSNYSDDQIKKLFKQINKESCGYVAIANAIFVQYHGDSAAFERDFGFPMHDENGDYNYDRLLLDIYAETDDKYYLDEEHGGVALTGQILKSYVGKEEEFKNKYGVPLYDDAQKTHYSIAAQQAVLDQYSGENIATLKSDGLTYLTFENRMQHYLKSRGVPVSSFMESSPSPDSVKSYLDQGKSVSIIDKDFTLYNEDGSKYRSDVGGHWMTITGVTDDGRYIVSSWGKKLYLKPDELNLNIVEVTDIYV